MTRKLVLFKVTEVSFLFEWDCGPSILAASVLISPFATLDEVLEDLDPFQRERKKFEAVVISTAVPKHSFYIPKLDGAGKGQAQRHHFARSKLRGDNGANCCF